MDKLQEFWDNVSVIRNQPDHDKLREGQILWIALSKLDYPLSERIVATELDPFYNNDHIKGFVNYITEFWSKQI